MFAPSRHAADIPPLGQQPFAAGGIRTDSDGARVGGGGGDKGEAGRVGEAGFTARHPQHCQRPRDLQPDVPVSSTSNAAHGCAQCVLKPDYARWVDSLTQGCRLYQVGFFCCSPRCSYSCKTRFSHLNEHIRADKDNLFSLRTKMRADDKKLVLEAMRNEPYRPTVYYRRKIMREPRYTPLWDLFERKKEYEIVQSTA
jgi:hypothetical protein